PFPGQVQVFRSENLLHQCSFLNSLMLLSAKALMRRGPSGLSVGHVLRGIRKFLFGSILHGRSRLPVSQFKRAYSSPRLVRPLLRPLLTSRRLLGNGISPGKSAFFPAQPPHLPPRANQTTSLCCASSSPVGG